MKATQHTSVDALCINQGESWCLYGSNRSGISRFFEVLIAQQKCHSRVEQLSFSSQQEIFEEELKKDDSDYLDHIDTGTLASSFVTAPERYDDFITAFNLRHCLSKGYRQLSSGESRKLLLLAAISREPQILCIENPYDGVDKNGCAELDRIFTFLQKKGLSVIITVNNRSDIPAWCSNIAVINAGQVILQGTQDTVIPQLETLKDQEKKESTLHLSLEKTDLSQKEAAPSKTEYIRLQDGFANYGETKVFSGLNLTIHAGQHTLFTGPNGCGKSTLLHIICGDNQNCYANDLHIMGKKRGSGESIWELKKHMGIVTPELHRNHHIPGSALQVVLSGFFDSIGMYQSYSKKQELEALHWLKMTGLQEQAKKPFRRLSYADQRLCLIARAMIKMPPLLILDEPTMGLDESSRETLLDFLERIAETEISTILYVSHREDEFRPFFKQHIDLTNYSATPQESLAR